MTTRSTDRHSPSDAGVPGKIARFLEKRPTQLPDSLLRRAKAASGAHGRTKASRQTALDDLRRTASKFDAAAVDAAVWANLNASKGRDTLVVRPTARVHPLSGQLDTASSPINLIKDPKDIVQHGFFSRDGDDDDFLLGGGLASLVPFGFVGGFTVGLGTVVDSTSFSWYFSDSAVPQDGVYIVRAVVEAWGRYWVKADDQAWDSKEAGVKMTTNMLGCTPLTFPHVLLDRSDDNIDEVQDFVDITELSGTCYLRAGQGLPIVVGVGVEWFAKGDDSHAVINLQESVGGVACLGCTAQWVAPWPTT